MSMCAVTQGPSSGLPCSGACIFAFLASGAPISHHEPSHAYTPSQQAGRALAFFLLIALSTGPTHIDGSQYRTSHSEKHLSLDDCDLSCHYHSL